MSKQVYVSLTRKSGNGTYYLQFKEIDYKNGLEVDDSKRVGFKEIQKGANPSQVLEYAQKQVWSLGDEQDNQGNYKVMFVREKTEEELKAETQPAENQAVAA